MRLDAIARALQDLSNDDAMDSGLDDAMAWVVRRTVVEVHQFPVFREDLELSTWCSGVGARWAPRRIQITGAQGASVEAETLWVHIDLTTGTPKRLPESFTRLYAPSAEGRTVRAKLEHGPAPDDLPVTPWPTRFADLDLMDHVNNALAWAIVEEHLAGRKDLRAPLRAEVEYPAATDAGLAEVAVQHTDDALELWISQDGHLRTTAKVTR